mgnify:CR=1 FL=1
MNNIIKSFGIITATLLLMLSCIKEPAMSNKDIEQRSLRAWIEKYHPELVDNYQEDGGYYVEIINEGVADSLPISGKDVWVWYDFTGRDLDGNIHETRNWELATQLGTFTKYTHYVPAYRFSGKERHVWKKYGETLKKIIESYAPGCRKEIAMHPNGLLWAQMDGVALSWMNAYVYGNPVTERAGYQVETNAYWYNALCFAIDMENKYGPKKSTFVERWAPVRDLVKENFQPTFWRPEWGYLVDYVGNGPVGQAVRPNMLIPAYLEYCPVDDEIISAIVMTVNDELLTKRGLRSLSPRNEAYRGVYEGSQIDRDLAYHQGCAFPDLLAPYIDLCFRMMGSTFYGRAKYLVEGFFEDISKHGVGAFSELYDGDPPHEPHGAIASAMSTAALLCIEYIMNQYNKEAR